ncbi:hypothetical protein M501DRAFT_927774 [Patellaria atrata CBS 101060]|uniref:BZIP domain-containing protein n=1 Tax=Patellaria atrata CBS 101060 TaxID=1346257 RepID=A0A9P4SHN6_9PEZI|nr:hypothetical protein M501DRAFT_927774 [Patellaria atrata CBS 101060]
MAAVATRSNNNSPHLNSRMSSPRDSKKQINSHREALEPSNVDEPSNTSNNNSNAQPLAPPPRPQNNTGSDQPDYFNQQHNSNNFPVEPNPFDQAFSSTGDTPGKSLLPPVASITSPASLIPGGTPGWPNSLRSGPLSPAMLTGPTSAGDYFSESHLTRGLFTPNESSLRTGLTPGGGGSMFPVPSPGSQAFFNSLQSGGATPSTIEFQRTALSAAAASKANSFSNNNPPTSKPPVSMSVPEPRQPTAAQPQQNQADPFGQHDANDAANGLFMLAQANGANRANNSQFAVPGQPAHAVNTNLNHQMGGQSQDTSPTSRRAKNSITSIANSAETGDFSDSNQSEQTKPTTRNRGKKGAAPKGQTNGRRKADDSVKAPPSKKAKSMSGEPMDMEMDDSEEDEDHKTEGGQGNKKMTDEEKRKNFLERNRVAALKCRQRKKQWLANLQAKVELFSTENDALSATVTQLREEIVNLKTLLLAHKDCPVSQSQGLGGMAMSHFLGEMNHHANPYGMGIQPNGQPLGMHSMPQQQGQGMRR